MSSVLSILGPSLATAAEAYLYSQSPEAALRREEIAARRRLLPMEVEGQELALQRAKQQLTQPKIQALGWGPYAVTNPDGTTEVKSVEVRKLPSTDPLKQMQAQAWELIRQKYPQGLTPDALRDPDVQQIIDTLIQRRSDLVVVPQVGAYRRPDLQAATPLPAQGVIPQGQPPQGTGAGPVSRLRPSAAPSRPSQAPAAAGGGTMVNVDATSDESIATSFEQMKPEEAAALITSLTQSGQVSPDELARLRTGFERVYGAPPDPQNRARWKTPVATVQRQPALPPGTPQPLVENPQLRRQAEQDYTRGVHDVQRLNLEIDRLTLAEKNAKSTEERARIAQQRAALHEQRQLAYRIETATRPYRQQLLAIERSEDVTNQLLPLITPYTYGPAGRLRQTLQTVVGVFPPVAEQQLESLRQDWLAEAQQGRASTDPTENRYATNFLTRYDPRMDKINFYTAILAYAHAKAQVQGQALRQGDIKRADQVMSTAQSPAGFANLLHTNQQYLARERGRLTRTIRDMEKRLGAAPGPAAPVPSETGSVPLPPGTTVEPDADDDALRKELD